jgi:hypothetical protein
MSGLWKGREIEGMVMGLVLRQPQENRESAKVIEKLYA